MGQVIVHPHICVVCKGEGVTFRHSHDCWGEPTCDEVRCCMCNGDGYIIPPNERRIIRSHLGLQ